MKTVMHVSGFFERGGAELIFNKTIDAAVDHGWQNVIVCSEPDTISNRKFLRIQSYDDGNKFLGVMNYIFNLKNYFLMKSMIKAHNPQIIHIHVFLNSLSPSILSAIKSLKKKYNFRLVETVHNFHLICPNASAFNYSKGSVCTQCIQSRFKVRIFFDNCDRRGWIYSFIKGMRSLVSNNFIGHKDLVDIFVVPSQTVFSHMIGEGVKPERIRVVPHPITLPVPQDLMAKENLIIYFGRISEEKNLDILLDAFTTISSIHVDWRLQIIGDGEHKWKLMNRVSNEMIRNVDFIPHVEHTQIGKYLSKSKISVLPSNWLETFGLSVYESVLYSNFPVVSEKGAMLEAVEFLGIGLTFRNSESTALLDCLNKVIMEYDSIVFEDPKARVLNFLSFEKYADRIDEIYSAEDV